MTTPKSAAVLLLYFYYHAGGGLRCQQEAGEANGKLAKHEKLERPKVDDAPARELPAESPTATRYLSTASRVLAASASDSNAEPAQRERPVWLARDASDASDDAKRRRETTTEAMERRREEETPAAHASATSQLSGLTLAQHAEAASRRRNDDESRSKRSSPTGQTSRMAPERE